MPKSPGLPYKKMLNDKLKPANYDRDVKSDVDRPVVGALQKAKASGLNVVKDPGSLWNDHYGEESKINVNAGISTPMAKPKK